MQVGAGNTLVCCCRAPKFLSNIECISYSVMKIIKFNIGVLVYNGSGKVVCKKYFLVMLVLIFTFVRLCIDSLDSYRIFSLLERNSSIL